MHPEEPSSEGSETKTLGPINPHTGALSSDQDSPTCAPVGTRVRGAGSGRSDALHYRTSPQRLTYDARVPTLAPARTPATRPSLPCWTVNSAVPSLPQMSMIRWEPPGCCLTQEVRLYTLPLMTDQQSDAEECSATWERV